MTQNKMNDFSFYLLMAILGSSVVAIVGFLLYSILFG